ncbi:NAD(P)H-hydrate dehydratase [Hoeflea prorocentri]|uniref:Bifunctional NAD(P)H-hydrate repair enzyme n=1 Tax=Hoeflea prorocentri TaxID=1922333 RepID=A0A9X3UGL9_9HYPH|nr:NAD(P)H-hydrate dehydratase [Hoeflea prorocentri]MCY6380927.1 NAD(P)H-hydrate dehydratase [Hoeflea prorocentri]MDA5398727.1 NAD(P)H-hydrate dehydratase [Hoeflea prorocentri]
MPPHTYHAPLPIVTPQTMGRIDAAAIGSGIEGYRLMLIAGSAISACVLEYYSEAVGAIVLCGPGNNGGDGYVAARYLAEAGMPVLLYSSIEPERLKGDAGRARADWSGPVYPLEELDCMPGYVVVDALFGAGLDRPIEGLIEETIAAITASALPVVAADLPSGISGRTGQVQGTALQAEHTVTFAALKPGHLLLPGAGCSGETHLVDIGIPRRVIDEHNEAMWRNDPALWGADLPVTGAAGHKYTRGHLCVFSGSFSHTGAARLAAHSALRSGAGLVTVLSPSSAVAANASHLTAVMLRKVEDQSDLDELLVDQRLGGFVLGPGFGIGEKLRQFALSIVKAGRSCVLDADGISAFSDGPEMLFALCRENPLNTVLTPHDGEFARLFPDLHADAELSKVDRARKAAERANAVILYKGADTVIAGPDGRVVINNNAPPWLATAGSGDCLAGIVGALLVQQMPPFEAAAAAAFLHGEAGKRAGEGLIADDLPDAIPPLTHYQSDNRGRG